MIKSLEVKQRYKSLSPFTWKDIPEFALIAGLNGSGKTQLLELIFNCISQHQYSMQVMQIESSQQIFGRVQFIPAYQQFGSLSSGAGTRQQIESRLTEIVQYLRQDSGTQNNVYYAKLLEYVRARSEKDLSELSSNEILRLIPPNYTWFIDNGFNNQYIAELFKSYQSRVEALKVECFDRQEFLSIEEIYLRVGFPPPWALINQIFDSYGFAYHIEEPKPNMNYTPIFKDKISSSSEINFDHLSSGEKIIVSLVLWAFNERLGEKNAIFLLDEFDAHLNPSLSRMFIEIVRDKLVKEYGIQVIMTSHSPSTIAYVEPSSLFTMEKGKEISRGDKKRIVNQLSDGVMTYDEASDLLSMLVSSSKQTILFTEGESDILHLNIAAKKLGIDIFYESFSCNGANKLKQFLVGCPSGLFSDKKIVGIFDYDQEGRKCISEIQANFRQINSNIFQSKSNENVFALILPTPAAEFVKFSYCPIEFLYPRAVLDSMSMLEKRDIREINNILESENQLSYADFQVSTELFHYKITERVTSKMAFANAAENFDVKSFENFAEVFRSLKEGVK